MSIIEFLGSAASDFIDAKRGWAHRAEYNHAKQELGAAAFFRGYVEASTYDPRQRNYARLQYEQAREELTTVGQNAGYSDRRITGDQIRLRGQGLQGRKRALKGRPLL